jgi:hypothetical protein
VHESRLVLICDDDKGSLGDVALQLVRVGTDAVYASDLYESELMARQEGRNIRAVLIPSSTTPERLDEVLECISPHTRVAIENFAVLGRRPHDKHVEMLRDHGVGWRLWAPYDNRDLRFLTWGLVWAGTDDDLRLHARIPTALPAKVARRGAEREVLIGDLSRSGAYIETGEPFPAGSQVHLSISLPVGMVEFYGITRWVASEANGPVRGRPPGFGMEFLEIPEGSLRAVVEHLESELDRFAL